MNRVTIDEKLLREYISNYLRVPPCDVNIDRIIKSATVEPVAEDWESELDRMLDDEIYPYNAIHDLIKQLLAQAKEQEQA